MRVLHPFFYQENDWTYGRSLYCCYADLPALQISNEILVVIFGVFLYIFLSLLFILIWVFLLRPLFIRPSAKKQGPTQAKPTTKQAPAQDRTHQDQASEPVPEKVGEAEYQLVLENGEKVRFTDLPISIGRAVDNDLVLDDETISAHHARIYFDELIRDICILDLDSLNGVFVSNQPTRKNILSDGNRIRLGSVPLVFRHTQPTTPNAA